MANTEPHVDSAGGSGEVMDRWKTDNCESGGDRLSSRSTSLSRRLIGLAGVAALTVGGAGAVLLGGGAAFASSPPSVTSSTYMIGTGAVSAVTVAPASTTANAATIYKVSFVSTDALATGADITVQAPFGAGPTAAATITDSGTGTQTGTFVSGTTSKAVFSTTAPIAAGDTVTVQFSAKNPGAQVVAASSILVFTGADPVQVSPSAGYTIVAAAAAVTPTDSVSSTVAGASGVTLTLGTFGVYDSTTTSATSLPTGSTLTVEFAGAAFTGSTSDYTVTDTPASGSATTQTPTSATPGTNNVALVTSAPLTVGDTITVTAKNVVNGSAATNNVTLLVTPATGSDVWEVVDPGTTTVGTFPGILLGSTATSVTGVSVTPVPATSSSVSTVTSTYDVYFTATHALTNTQTVVITLPSGVAAGSSSNVIDNTSGTIVSSATTALSASSGSSANNIATVTTGTAISAGDSVEIQLIGVTNPSSAGSDTATVSTTTDTVAVSASYSIVSPTSQTNAPSVTLSDSAASAASNYTISQVKATAAMPVGVAATPGQIDLAFPSGTVLPSAVSDYTITDVTNSASTGVAANVTIGSWGDTNGANAASSAQVQLTVSKAIAAGDVLSITVDGVINPSSASSQYVVDMAGVSYVTSAITSVNNVPIAATTYPNGALVQSGGNQIDVIAGGVGFGIPSMSVYDLIAASDSSAVVAGSFPTATTVRTGTVLKVVGSPAIYVVGTNGDAYAFSTPTEFTSDGYSAKSVVSVPSLGSLTIGSGAAPTAAVTMPDGALVQSGTTIYVYAGGKAFGIPTWSEYQTIAAVTGSSVVQGTVSNTSATSLTAGTLIQPIGSFGIWVSDGSSIYQFSTASQFASDGYNGANVVPVPNATGLTQA